MGQMRFVAPCPERLTETAAKMAYVAGMEGVPWRCRSVLMAGETDASQRGTLLVERAVKESGNLCLPWRVEGHGELVLATASLMERSKPYNLPVELARGAVNRLRNQLAEWQMLGLAVPEGLEAAVKTASAAFSRVVTSSSEIHAAELAEEVLRLAIDATVTLVEEHSRQMLSARHQQGGALATLLGGRLPLRPLSDAEIRLLPSAWNSAVVPFPWCEIERSTGQFQWNSCDQLLQWCRDQGWQVLGGPLLCLNKCRLPDWVYLWEDDFDQLQSCVTQFVRATVERYRRKVDVWYCAARVNMEGVLALSEEQRLRLVVAAVDEARRADPQTPILIGFDQPWAEYLATTAHELYPLHFADSLIRADLGVTGVGLELNVGHWPGGTLPRDLIELSRQLDRWSLLGLPLFVFLSIAGRDKQTKNAELAAWSRIADAETEAGEDVQASWTKSMLPLFLSKHYVQGVFWNKLCDADPCEFAGSGLFDTARRPKPLLDVLASIRQQHLT